VAKANREHLNEVRRGIFRAQGFAVAVDVPAQSHLTWLTEFLHPQFLRDDDRAAECVISVNENRDRFEEFLSRGPESTDRQIPCFLLDGNTESFPLWNAPPGHMAVHEPAADAIYVVAENGKRIEIIVRNMHPWIRVRIMRVIREVMMARLRRDGWFILHAAAASVEGRAIAIAGPKNSGKTNLLIRLVRECAARPISYDRLAVLPGAATVVGQGVPTTVSVRAATAAMNPDLFRFLDPDHRRCALTEIEQGISHGNREFDANQKRILMNPRQFRQLFDVKSAEGGPLAAIVFPHVNHDERETTIRQLPPKEIRERLQTSLFGFNFEPLHLSLFARKFSISNIEPSQLMTQIDSFANNVSAFDIVIASTKSGETGLDKPFLEALGI
jgi:hypothetical protein